MLKGLRFKLCALARRRERGWEGEGACIVFISECLLKYVSLATKVIIIISWLVGNSGNKSCQRARQKFLRLFVRPLAASFR